MHPQMDYELVHENPYRLLESNTREEAIDNLTYEATQEGEKTGSTMSIKAGQKIPYNHYSKAKKYLRKYGQLFVTFYVIHITRNPVDTINSKARTFKANPYLSIFYYFFAVPRVKKFMKQYGERVYEIEYEKFITDSHNEVKRLYKWLGAEVEDHYIHKVLTTREPWNYDGRVMPGLRYFNKIENRISKNQILRKPQIKLINLLTKITAT